MRTALAAAAALTVSLAAGTAHAAQVLKYTGTQVQNGKYFEIFIRYDAPHQSFTMTSDGLTFGFDDTYMPLDLELRGDRYLEFAIKDSQLGLDNNLGLTYFAGRLTPNNQLKSVLSFRGRYFLPPVRGRLLIESAEYLEEPDLLAGYVDLSGLRPGMVVPEPASWALMILGFGAVGAMSRRRRYLAA